PSKIKGGRLLLFYQRSFERLETGGRARTSVGRMRKLLTSLLLLGTAGEVFGQEYYRHTFTVNLGAGRPRGELRSLFSDSFLAGVEYGYRFHRNFQVDAGF